MKVWWNADLNNMLRLCKFSLKNYAVKNEVDHFQEMVPYYVIKHKNQ